MTPATAEEVMEVFWERLRAGDISKYNWGTASDNSIWNVGADSYINGVMLNVDFDYEGMWLLEVCDRDRSKRDEPTLVRWLAMATTSKRGRLWAWFDAPGPQAFFERVVSSWDVIEWAVGWYKEIDVKREAKK